MIRAARPSDKDAIFALERSVTEAAHWNIGEYMQILRVEDPKAALQRWIFVAEEDEELLGFIVVKLLRAGQEMEAEVENLAVSTKVRRRGVGSALCVKALEICHSAGAETIELEVRAGNAAALGLYGRLGFERYGMRARYYADPKEDAALLRIFPAKIDKK